MVFWVFGYGSLVWNPGFVYDEKIIGFIKDYRRVFDLACIDHRGTPENPARTCTLEQIEGAICWGAAYCVRGGPEKERLAMEYLERRECEYDHKTLVEFYKEEDPLQPALTGVVVFTSTPDVVSNKYYLGPAPLEEMARQIATASGPCGNNRDYLFKLEKALFDMGHEDDMVIELANEVRKVLGVGKGMGLMALITDAKLGFHAAWVATIKMYFVIMGLGPGVLSLFRPKRSWWDYTQKLQSQGHIPALQTSLLAEAVAAD